MILKDPDCPKCSDYGYVIGLGTVVPSGPGDMIKDAFKVSLLANIPMRVSFKNISVLNGSKWIFAGMPLCYDSSNASIPWEVTDKDGTGFTVVADSDATFEGMCVKK